MPPQKYNTVRTICVIIPLSSWVHNLILMTIEDSRNKKKSIAITDLSKCQLCQEIYLPTLRVILCEKYAYGRHVYKRVQNEMFFRHKKSEVGQSEKFYSSPKKVPIWGDRGVLKSIQ